MTDIDYFKKELDPFLNSCNLEFRYFPEGDFDALEQVVSETQSIGRNFDFWNSGWLEVYICDYISDLEICNKFFEPKEEHQAVLKDVVVKMLL